jgi:hypothetical protein
MNRKKYILVSLVMTLFMVLSAGTALAGDWNKADPGPTIEEHPPDC